MNLIKMLEQCKSNQVRFTCDTLLSQGIFLWYLPYIGFCSGVTVDQFRLVMMMLENADSEWFTESESANRKRELQSETEKASTRSKAQSWIKSEVIQSLHEDKPVEVLSAKERWRAVMMKEEQEC